MPSSGSTPGRIAESAAGGGGTGRLPAHCTPSEHQWQQHDGGQRGDGHANTVEGAWALLKRGVAGLFYKVSRKHLDRYLDEFEFRFNNRNNPFIFRDALRELLGANPVRYAELIS